MELICFGFITKKKKKTKKRKMCCVSLPSSSKLKLACFWFLQFFYNNFCISISTRLSNVRSYFYLFFQFLYIYVCMCMCVMFMCAYSFLACLWVNMCMSCAIYMCGDPRLMLVISFYNSFTFFTEARSLNQYQNLFIFKS